jgi:protein-tyrosine phosphatase
MLVDLHTHVLFGVDDGAPALEISLALLEQAVAAGISKILATPHVNAHTTARAEEQIRANFAELQKRLRQKKIPVSLKLAAEVNLIGSTTDWLSHSWLLIGGQQRYILVETPFFELPAGFADILFNIRLQKITPILAHPERNIKFQQDPSILIEWINQGTLLQMDAGSISGLFGRRCRNFSQRLLRASAVHLLASDTHDLQRRTFQHLARAFQIIKKDFNEDYARLLCQHNPGRIWAGRKIDSVQPDETRLHLNKLQKYWQIISDLH